MIIVFCDLAQTNNFLLCILNLINGFQILKKVARLLTDTYIIQICRSVKFRLTAVCGRSSSGEIFRKLLLFNKDFKS